MKREEKKKMKCATSVASFAAKSEVKVAQGCRQRRVVGDQRGAVVK